MARRSSSRPSMRFAFMLTGGIAVAVAATAFIGPPDSVVAQYHEVSEPVGQSTSVCSYVGGESDGGSRIGVLALAGIDEPAVSAEAEAESSEPIVVDEVAEPDPEAEDDDPLLVVDERGVPEIGTVRSSSPTNFAVRASGPLAPGVVAEQYTRYHGVDVRGVMTAECAAPGRDHWFVGVASGESARGRLVLTNPSATPTVVTVSVFGDDGPIETPGTKDISIPAYGSELLVLDALADGAENLAVRVRATQGRVAAAIELREWDDDGPRGVTMVPPTTSPSDSVVVSGIPGHGERSLRVLAPGDTDAIVSVQVLGPDGRFSPLGHNVITVPAGSVIDVPMDDVLGDAAAAVALESDEEITAALRVVSSGDDMSPDVAYSAATSALPSGPTAVVLTRDDSRLAARLLLTSVADMAGRVTVTVIDEDGEFVTDEIVDIEPWSTTVVDLDAGEDGGWATTVIDIGTGGVVTAVREMYGDDGDGMLLDLMPVTAPELNVRVPRVVNELPTGLAPAGEEVDE